MLKGAAESQSCGPAILRPSGYHHPKLSVDRDWQVSLHDLERGIRAPLHFHRQISSGT